MRGFAESRADLGLSYDQSSQWQQLAAVPEAEFEARLAAPREGVNCPAIVLPVAEGALSGRLC